MIPIRVGDTVQVSGDTWFAGATGHVRDVVPDLGTLMVELDEYGQRVVPGLILPFAPAEVSVTSCQHPTVTEAVLWDYINRRWYDIECPRCPDCDEYLYPEEDEIGEIRIYVGEPKGAGA